MHRLPRSLYKPPPDPWCKVCGGRHKYEQCSIHAPVQPPQDDAPDREHFGPRAKLPPAPENATIFRGKFTFPLASFHWRRMIHSLLWKYSNTEQDSLLPPLLTLECSFSVPAIRVDRIQLDSMHELQLGLHAATASPSYINWVAPPCTSFSAPLAILDRKQLDIMHEDLIGYDEAYDELVREGEYLLALDEARNAKHEVLTELKARFARKA